MAAQPTPRICSTREIRPCSPCSVVAPYRLSSVSSQRGVNPKWIAGVGGDIYTPILQNRPVALRHHYYAVRPAPRDCVIGLVHAVQVGNALRKHLIVG